MKCEVTGEQIPMTFLGKIIGTMIKDDAGKKHFVSAAVQQKYKNDKKQILAAIS